jgi:microcystin-dependent protein
MTANSYYTQPRTWVAGEVVTATMMNQHVRDTFKALGEWAPGDIKVTYRTDAAWAGGSLVSPEVGWYAANGATKSDLATTDPYLFAILGSTTLPDFRDRFVLVSGSSFARGAAGGEVNHTLTAGEMPVHTHTVNETPHAHTYAKPTYTNTLGPTSSGAGAESGSGTTSSVATGISLQNAGSGGAHNNMPPYHAAGMVLIKNDS